MHRAAEVGAVEVVAALLAAGASTSVKEAVYGKTAEKVAEEMNQPEVLALLRAAAK